MESRAMRWLLDIMHLEQQQGVTQECVGKEHGLLLEPLHALGALLVPQALTYQHHKLHAQSHLLVPLESH